MKMKELRIGMIGYGFMGKAHSNAYAQANHFFPCGIKPVMKALCARNAEKAQSFATNWGYESIETDWRKLLERKDIDAVDICTPNNIHKDIAIAAAKAGKMILCEKPLAMNAAEGEEMCQAVEKAGVANMVWYNYRHVERSLLQNRLSIPVSSDASFIIAPIFCRTGPSTRMFHKVARAHGDWMSKRRVAV